MNAFNIAGHLAFRFSHSWGSNPRSLSHFWSKSRSPNRPGHDWDNSDKDDFPDKDGFDDINSNEGNSNDSIIFEGDDAFSDDNHSDKDDNDNGDGLHVNTNSLNS